jgi:hypothetical protein
LRTIELTNLAEVSVDHTLGYVRSDIYTATLHAKPTVPGVAFKILGRDLMTNMENAKLAYIHDEDDPNQFDELFIDALSLRLAADLAGVFPESSGFQSNMMSFYQQVLFEARGVDASESKPSETATLVSVRA